MSSQLQAEKLYEEEIICFASQNNPLLSQPISLKDYLACKHIALVLIQQDTVIQQNIYTKKKSTQ